MSSSMQRAVLLLAITMGIQGINGVSILKANTESPNELTKDVEERTTIQQIVPEKMQLFDLGLDMKVGVTNSSFTVDNIIYRVTDANNAEVEIADGTQYTGEELPDTVTYQNVTYTITGIGNQAFNNQSQLVLTKLPSSVKRIENYAFTNCANLKLSELPEGLEYIGKYAFKGCSNLTLTSLPEKLITIEQYAFAGCTNIQVGELPEGITKIEDEVFHGCSSLELTSLPNTIISIGTSSFEGCTKLALTSLPDTLTTIGVCAFCDCGELELEKLPESVISIGKLAFRNCKKITLETLPAGITEMADSTFEGCKNIKLSALPTGLTRLGSWALYGTGITELHVPTTLVACQAGSFPVNVTIITTSPAHQVQLNTLVQGKRTVICRWDGKSPIVAGAEVKVADNIEVDGDYILPKDATLEIPNGNILTIPNGYSLIVEDETKVKGLENIRGNVLRAVNQFKVNPVVLSDLKVGDELICPTMPCISQTAIGGANLEGKWSLSGHTEGEKIQDNTNYIYALTFTAPEGYVFSTDLNKTDTEPKVIVKEDRKTLTYEYTQLAQNIPISTFDIQEVKLPALKVNQKLTIPSIQVESKTVVEGTPLQGVWSLDHVQDETIAEGKSYTYYLTFTAPLGYVFSTNAEGLNSKVSINADGQSIMTYSYTVEATNTKVDKFEINPVDLSALRVGEKLQTPTLVVESKTPVAGQSLKGEWQLKGHQEGEVIAENTSYNYELTFKAPLGYEFDPSLADLDAGISVGSDCKSITYGYTVDANNTKISSFEINPVNLPALKIGEKLQTPTLVVESKTPVAGQSLKGEWQLKGHQEGEVIAENTSYSYELTFKAPLGYVFDPSLADLDAGISVAPDCKSITYGYTVDANNTKISSFEINPVNLPALKIGEKLQTPTLVVESKTPVAGQSLKGEWQLKGHQEGETIAENTSYNYEVTFKAPLGYVFDPSLADLDAGISVGPDCKSITYGYTVDANNTKISSFEINPVNLPALKIGGKLQTPTLVVESKTPVAGQSLKGEWQLKGHQEGETIAENTSYSYELTFKAPLGYVFDPSLADLDAGISVAPDCKSITYGYTVDANNTKISNFEINPVNLPALKIGEKLQTPTLVVESKTPVAGQSLKGEWQLKGHQEGEVIAENTSYNYELTFKAPLGYVFDPSLADLDAGISVAPDCKSITYGYTVDANNTKISSFEINPVNLPALKIGEKLQTPTLVVESKTSINGQSLKGEWQLKDHQEGEVIAENMSYAYDLVFKAPIGYRFSEALSTQIGETTVTVEEKGTSLTYHYLIHAKKEEVANEEKPLTDSSSSSHKVPVVVTKPMQTNSQTNAGNSSQMAGETTVNGDYTPYTSVEELHEKIKVPEKTANEVFKDVPPTYWGYQSIYEVYNKGIVTGVSKGIFAPKQNLKVADTFTFLDRELLTKGISELKLPRETVEKYMTQKSHWAFNASASIGGKLNEVTLSKVTDLDSLMSRGMLAQVLYEITEGKLESVNPVSDFKDIAQSPYKEAINYCVATGLLKGVTTTKMAPTKAVTRAELMSILTRLDQVIK